MLGRKLGDRYEVTRELGRGGMGVVYAAHDPVLDREVAIKTVSPAQIDKELQERFKREARVVAQMDHPSIVGVYDFGASVGATESESILFFVMPFVRGTTFRDALSQGILSRAAILDLGAQIASALAYSHDRGIIHRDMKPENVMLVKDEGAASGHRARVADFGLALSTDDPRFTRAGVVVGTVAYLAPEQVTGAPVTGRTDVYALGATLYEALTGHVPFSGEMHTMLFRIANQEVPPPGIAPDVDAFLLACLQKDPQRRPPAAQAAQHLAALARGQAPPDDAHAATVAIDVRHELSTPKRPPIVGRDTEVATLREKLAAASAGESQIVLVTGETGIGKSRLLDELETIASGAQILRASFAEEALPLQAFADLLARSSESAPDLLAETGDRTKSYEAISQTLLRLSQGRPLVLLLDDLHASVASAEALQYIALRLAAGSTLIVGAYTDSEVDRAHPIKKLESGMKSSRRFASLALDRLGVDAYPALLEGYVPGAQHVAAEVAHRLHDVTEGNPFVAREMVRSLLESGAIAVDDGGTLSFVHADGLTTETELPKGAKDAIERRLERLDDVPRKILGLASLLGRSFDVRDLEALVEEEDVDGELDDVIDGLVNGGFLREPREAGRGADDRLAFTSGVMSDVLYAALPRRKRRKLHVLAAESIEKRAKGKLDRVYGPLLHHYARGDNAEKAIPYGLEHARRSLASLALDEALAAAKTVLGFVEDDGGSAEGVVEVRLLLGAIHRKRGHHETAIKEYETALKAAAGPARLPAMVDLVETAWEARRAGDVARWLDKTIEAARAANEDAIARRLLLMGSTVATLRGDAARAKTYADEAAALGAENDVPAPSSRQGTVVVVYRQTLGSIDPRDGLLSFHLDIGSAIFETLTQEGAGAQIVPLLAESFTAEDGGRRYRFKLRSDARFHDGRPVTSEDVRASWQRQLSHRPDELLHVIRGTADVAAGKTDDWVGFRIESESEFVIELESPLAVFPALAAYQVLSVMPKDVRFGGGWRDGCVGTGPFRIVRFDPERRLELEANPDYRRPGYPRSKALVVDFGVPEDEIVAQFEAGRVSMMTELTPRRIDELRANPVFAASYHTRPSTATSALLFNMKKGPMADPAARRRIAEALDAPSFIRQFFPRGPAPATSFIPSVFHGDDVPRAPSLKPGSTSDAFAATVAGSGARPPALRLGLLPAFRNAFDSFTRELIARLERRGIPVEADAVSTEASTTEELAERFDICLGGWAADYPDPDGFIYAALHSTAGWYGRFSGHPEIDELIERARVCLDQSERRRLYHDAAQRLRDRDILIPLFHADVYAFLRPEVRGVEAFARNVATWRFDELWLDNR